MSASETSLIVGRKRGILVAVDINEEIGAEILDI